MKASAECVRCFVDDLAGAIKTLQLNDELSKEIFEESLKFLSENIGRWELPSFYITEIHRILKRKTGLNDPFSQMRKKTNEICLEISKHLEEEIAKLPEEERIRKLIRWSIAGNHLDFRTVGRGYKDPLTVKEELEKIVDGKIHINDTEKFLKLHPADLLFVHDNVGEIVFDMLLIKEMKNKGIKVFSALRGGPITSDATVDDGREIGMHKYAEIVEASSDTLGISWEEMGPRMHELINKVELIISKGQANYYVFSLHRKEIKPPIFFLLKTKCAYISRTFGFDERSISVAALNLPA